MTIVERIAINDEMIADVVADINESSPQRRVKTVVGLCAELMKLKKRELSYYVKLFPPRDQHIQRVVDSAYYLGVRETYKTKQEALDHTQVMFDAMVNLISLLANVKNSDSLA